MDRSKDYQRGGNSNYSGKSYGQSESGGGYRDNRGRGGQESFNSGSSHYQQRGRGDSRGRGQDNRGGAGGGGFPDKPVIVATTRPG